MTLVTRAATRADLPGIQRIAQETLAQESQAIEPAEAALERLYSAAALEAAIASPYLSVIVAARSGEVVGFARYGTPILEDCDCEDLKLIHALRVHPHESWSGVAEALLHGIEEALDENARIQRIGVYVDPAQRDRVQFYARQGFHHEAPEDEDGLWYMELAL